MPKATAIARMQNLFITCLLFWGNEREPKWLTRRDIQGANLALGGWVNPKLGQKMRGVKKRLKQVYMTVRSLQVFNVISHFFGFKDFPYQHQRLNDIANTPCVLTTVNNA
jgi:hypothetical protein